MIDKCSKCDGSGKIPLKNKAGEVVPYAWVFCECHPVYGDNTCPSIPLVTEGRRPGTGSQRLPRKIPRGRMHLYIDDFDFPMSYDFYRSLCCEYGWPDPGSLEPKTIELQPQIQEVIHRHSDMGKKEFDLLQQTAHKVDYLLKRANKAADKKGSKYTIE